MYEESCYFQASLGHLSEVEPVYESPFSLQGADYGQGLPRAGRLLVDYLEDRLKVTIRFVSYGEERSKTIEL